MQIIISNISDQFIFVDLEINKHDILQTLDFAMNCIKTT